VGDLEYPLRYALGIGLELSVTCTDRSALRSVLPQMGVEMSLTRPPRKPWCCHPPFRFARMKPGSDLSFVGLFVNSLPNAMACIVGFVSPVVSVKAVAETDLGREVPIWYTADRWWAHPSSVFADLQ
jgi:hypothetical protein